MSEISVVGEPIQARYQEGHEVAEKVGAKPPCKSIDACRINHLGNPEVQYQQCQHGCKKPITQGKKPRVVAASPGVLCRLAFILRLVTRGLFSGDGFHPVFQQIVQKSGIVEYVFAFHVTYYENLQHFVVQVGQFQPFHDLFMNPLVVSNRICLPGNKHTLQKLLECLVQAVKCVEMQVSLQQGAYVLKVIGACFSNHVESCGPQSVAIIRQPFLPKLLKMWACRVQDQWVCNSVSYFYFESIRSPTLVPNCGDECSVKIVNMQS